MKVLIYRLLTNLTKVVMSFFWRERQRETEREVQLNSETIRNNRYEEKFITNVINLSSHHLSNDEISLLSKGLKFVPTPKHINKAKKKKEIEVYGRKLRLMWYFRNNH